MAFKVDLGARNRQFLRNLPLSREGKIKVWIYIHVYIANVSDAFRNDPVNRAPGSQFFRMQHVFRDDHGDGRVHLIDFFIDDSPAPYGVLRVDFVDFQ